MNANIREKKAHANPQHTLEELGGEGVSEKSKDY